MIRRYSLYELIPLLLALLAAGLGFWLWTRPTPAPYLEHLTLADGSSLISVTPGTQAKARVAIAVPPEQHLSDRQLLNLSQAGDAQLVQVILPSTDCLKQQQAPAAGHATADCGAHPGCWHRPRRRPGLALAGRAIGRPRTRHIRRL